MDEHAAYLALAAREARFDGRLFVGVSSTGIYCRPICRVRTPKFANCRFFETAAQAEVQGFRPCLKCRPEIAPGAGAAWSVMDASRTLARQAAEHLDAHAASGEVPSLAALAARLGISDRHLRRIFQAEHGVTPVQHLQTRRLLLAKQLLTDSRLPVAQVALASGFRSLRRFNAAFADSYRMSPGRLRRDAADGPGGGGGASGGPPGGDAAASRPAVTVTLAYRAPYDAARLLRFFAQRAIPGIEQVDVDGTAFGLPGIRRSVRAGVLSARAGWIEAVFPPALAQVRLRFGAGWARDSGAVLAAARRWLDLDASPQCIASALHGAPAAEDAAAASARLPGQAGLRLPGCVDAFELAVRAVLGQQVTVAAARTLAQRLVERFGESPVDAAPAATPASAAADASPWPAVTRFFPSPEVLAGTAPERIGELGIIRSRAAAIVALARAWADLQPLTATRQPAEPLIERLCALPGIGPWTAHYIAMRALSWPDAFPPNDVAVLKAMQRLFGGGVEGGVGKVAGDPPPAASPIRQRDAEAIALAWRPWRSYAVLGLWNTLDAADAPTAAASSSTSKAS